MDRGLGQGASLMMDGSYAGNRNAKRVLLSLLASACLIVGSPVAASSAAAGGAQKPVSATHGDCKNDNAGKHKGYVCPSDNGDDTVEDDGGISAT
jgi:hypothetical protein